MISQPRADVVGVSLARGPEHDDLDWLRNFEQRRGRPLRVLHVGNIANNAYLNAVFLRRVGIDCHVLCSDYYDPMATPEWEAPAGSSGKFKRPHWFVQGPQHLCLPYLHAMLDGRRGARHILWLRLRVETFLLAGSSTRALGSSLKQRARRAKWFGSSLKQRAARRAKWFGSSLRHRARRARWRLSWARSWTWSLTRWAGRKTARTLGFSVPEPLLQESSVITAESPAIPSDETEPSQKAGVKAESLGLDDPRRYRLRKLELVKAFAAAFPDRLDKLDLPDFVLGDDAQRWATLFARYDVVQCYATYPIVAMLATTRPYVAYEHGTLRHFTMGDDPTHRQNALAYYEADHVFVTNGDCLAYAQQLGLENYSPMIHPVDVDQHEQDYTTEISEIRARIGADVILFCPIRHDWAIKGTDIHIRALPRIVEQTSGRVALVLCEWGAEVDASRRLADELGVTENLVWLPPLNRAVLIAHLKAADVVLDQMALPHFGATAPQALAAGSPVVMSYEPESTEWIVDEPAPILAAFDPHGVAAAVATALDPEWRQDFATRARDWVQRYHHPRRLVLEHSRVYRRILEEVE